MTYQPWGYEHTKKLHDLFQEKFGKVWESTCIDVFTIYLQQINDEDAPFLVVEDDKERYRSNLPALTFSAFCEFVDLVFVGNDGNDIYTHKLPQIMYETVSVAANYRREELYDSVNIHLKHFALDNWSEPEKVIEEVKKYL